MKAWIVAVGSELLTPHRIDTNSLHITERLNTIGYDVHAKSVVGDDVEELVAVFRRAGATVDLVVCTGGLGPTTDDITRDAAAAAFDLPLDDDPRILAAIRDRFERRGLRMPAINQRQAQVPRGAVALDNAHGTAPGLWIDRGRTKIVLLPGPPREMTPMLDALIATRLAPSVPGRGLFRRVLKITGLSESEVDTIAAPIYSPWLTAEGAISTTILASMGQIELHLTTVADSPEAGHRVLAGATRQLVDALGSAVYSSDGQSLEAVVGQMLRQRRLTIAVAESCSGGLLASRLTDVPGSSDYFDRGIVSYSNEAKIEWLDVAPALIEAHGAVSEPVARAMAEGIRVRSHVPVGIGITGIAGPGGGSAEKPVGTVAVAVSVLNETRARTFRFPGDRAMVKFQSAQAAMNMLRLMLQDTIVPAVD